MIRVKIITPSQELVDQEVDSISLPTEQGLITVLSGHAPLVSRLTVGEIHYRVGDQTSYIATDSGLVEVKSDNSVMVIAELATESSEIDLDATLKAKHEAEKFLATKEEQDTAYYQALARLELELAKLRAVNRHRS